MLRKALVHIIAAMVIGLAFAGGPASAADAKLMFGKVDLGQIYKCPRVEQSNQEIQNLLNLLRTRLEIRQANRLLSEQELTELQTLREKQNPTEADKARIKALEDLAKQKDGQLRDLAQKKDPTDQERAALAELQARDAAANKSLDELSKAYEKQLQEKQTQISEKLKGEILAAVKAVAEAQNLSFVVDQQAVLYGGIDITAAVLDKLSPKK